MRSPIERFLSSRSTSPILDIPSGSRSTASTAAGVAARCRGTALSSDQKAKPAPSGTAQHKGEHHEHLICCTRLVIRQLTNTERHGPRALAGVVALFAIEAYAALARAAGIPLKAGLPGTHTASLVTARSFATGIVIATFWGTVVAVILARYASRPARTFTIIAAAATALSLITPLDAFGAALNTKLTLAAGHLIVASIMTTILRREISRAQS